MASIPSFFADAVVAIGFEKKNGEIMWGASGFFYFHTLKGENGRVYLVTNKHVLDGNKKIFLRINPKALGEPKGYSVDLVDKNGEKLWNGHYNKKVDVAVIPINFQIFQDDNMQVHYFRDIHHTLEAKSMEEAGQTEGDSVFTLGFPVSIVGDKSNSVIVRSGTIARIRDTLKSPQVPYLIDTTVFPGNSGGPVVNKPELIGIEGTKNIEKASLIGIVASYMPYLDVAVSQQTGKPRVIFEENSGLSNVFSVECIKTTINSYERRIKQKAKLVEPQKSTKAMEKPNGGIDTNFK